MENKRLTDLYACHLTQDLMATNYLNLKTPEEVEEFHGIIRMNMQHYMRAIRSQEVNRGTTNRA